MAQFLMSWGAFNNNICSGLSALQQNGELVDMTLAADGHHVKVHQLVMSLVSPYIKELITSANCPHPVIFLNKISYQTFCYLLQYIYTGEVLITKENLPELVEAGKELRIKGLEDMVYSILESSEEPALASSRELRHIPISRLKGREVQDEIPQLQIRSKTDDRLRVSTDPDKDESLTKNCYDDDDVMDHDDELEDEDLGSKISKANKETVSDAQVQYTTSNQGALQMILNRFVYFLRYTSQKQSPGRRQWRCVEYCRGKCPAYVVTRNGVVTQRLFSHNHPFHDKKILKKVRDNAVYSAVKDAETLGQSIKIKKKHDMERDKINATKL